MRARGNDTGSCINGERYVFSAVLLMLLLIVVYGNSFHAPFFFDDFINIVDNPNIQANSFSPDELADAIHGRDLGRSKISRPVAYFTLALNHAMGGLEPFGYHVVNFAIHAAATISLFFFTYRILCLSRFGKTWSRQRLLSAALLSAALWATHPVQVTAVAYIVQRMTALAGLFTLLSMHSYIEARTARSRLSRGICTATCAIFGALAVGSKENAAMLPVNIALLELLVVGVPAGKSRRFNVYLLGVAALLVLCAGLWFADIGNILGGYESRPFGLGQRLLTEPRVFLFYLSQLLYPTSHRFTILHDIALSTGWLTPWTTLPAMALTLAIPAGAWYFTKRCPLVSFSLLFFWVNHLIEGTVIPLEIVFEHRNYLPSMFVFLLPAVGFVWLVEKYPLRYPPLLLSVLLLTVFLLSQGHTTFMRNELLSNPVLAWLDNVNKAPALHRPHHNLGGAYLILGLEEKGVAQLQKALNCRAAGRYDQKYETHYNLGIYYLSKNKPAAAVEHMRSALGYAPRNGKLLLGMSRALFFSDDLKQAETYATYALGAASLRPEALTLLGWIRLKQGDPAEARKKAVAALKLSPESRKPFFLIGESFRMENDPAKALHYYSLHRRDHSRNVFVLAALIEVQEMLGKTAARQKTVWQLLEKAGGRLAEVLATYDRRYNGVGKDRMKRIQSAIAQTVGQALPAEIKQRG